MRRLSFCTFVWWLVTAVIHTSEFEVIGTLENNNFKKPVLDRDKVIGALTDKEHQMVGVKVPGLRNASLMAPYMHNGSLKTLEEGLLFYNKAGAAGLGIPISNQTLPSTSLDLNKQEMNDIIHFIQSLTDTSGKMPAHHSRASFVADWMISLCSRFLLINFDSPRRYAMDHIQWK